MANKVTKTKGRSVIYIGSSARQSEPEGRTHKAIWDVPPQLASLFPPHPLKQSEPGARLFAVGANGTHVHDAVQAGGVAAKRAVQVDSAQQVEVEHGEAASAGQHALGLSDQRLVLLQVPVLQQFRLENVPARRRLTGRASCAAQHVCLHV